MTEVYIYSEDSALLRSSIKGYAGGSLLEMGTGNCGNLVGLEERFELVVGTDLVRPRMKPKGVEGLLSDRGTCFRDGVFDLVAFNPPYLPSDGVEDPAVDGGKDGVEVPLSFLVDALRVVKDDGRVLMLLPSSTNLTIFVEECRNKGFGIRKIAEKKLFFEELAVFEIYREKG